MPRALSPERQAEYEQLKAFTLALASVIDSLPTMRGEATTPSANGFAASLRQALGGMEQRAPAQALAGLRMARNDCLEMTRHLSARAIQAIDGAFATNGLPTLSQVRAEVWRVIPKVLKRGRIQNEEEYYLIIERVNDMSATDGLAEHDRILLGKLAAEYEDKRGASPA